MDVSLLFCIDCERMFILINHFYSEIQGASFEKIASMHFVQDMHQSETNHELSLPALSLVASYASQS